MSYLTELTGKGQFLQFDKISYSKSITTEQGTSPHSSGPDIAIIVRSIVLAFRLRSRRPVLALARTAHDDY